MATVTGLTPVPAARSCPRSALEVGAAASLDAEFYLKCRGQVSLPGQGHSGGLRHGQLGRVSEAGAPLAPRTVDVVPSAVADAGPRQGGAPAGLGNGSWAAVSGAERPHQTFQLPHISLPGPVT